MASFRYKAVSADGQTVRGRIDAHNLIDLEMRLQQMQLDLVRGQALDAGSHFGRRRVPRRELITFCFHLEQLLRAGVPIIDGLTDLRDSSEHPRFREIVAGVIESVAGGETLSGAMGHYPQAFDRVFVSLIRAGESAGRLPEVLRDITAALKWEDELASHTRKILAYPAFVGSIVVAATAFLMAYMVPQLKQFVHSMGQELPAQTRLLFFVSDALVAYWQLVLLLPATVAIAGALALRSNPAARLRFDGGKLRLPLVGAILRKIILSRLANTFALLYASGIPIVDAIRTTRDVVGNRAIEEGLRRVEYLIGEGQNLSQSFQATGLFPPLVVRMLRVGEGSGALDAALVNVGYFYNRDVKESAEQLHAVIEPLLTVLLGTFLGWIMLSVLGPVYDVIGRTRI